MLHQYVYDGQDDNWTKMTSETFKNCRFNNFIK